VQSSFAGNASLKGYYKKTPKANRGGYARAGWFHTGVPLAFTPLATWKISGIDDKRCYLLAVAKNISSVEVEGGLAATSRPFKEGGNRGMPDASVGRGAPRICRIRRPGATRAETKLRQLRS